MGLSRPPRGIARPRDPRKHAKRPWAGPAAGGEGAPALPVASLRPRPPAAPFASEAGARAGVCPQHPRTLSLAARRARRLAVGGRLSSVTVLIPGSVRLRRLAAGIRCCRCVRRRDGRCFCPKVRGRRECRQRNTGHADRRGSANGFKHVHTHPTASGGGFDRSEACAAGARGCRDATRPPRPLLLPEAGVLGSGLPPERACPALGAGPGHSVGGLGACGGAASEWGGMGRRRSDDVPPWAATNRQTQPPGRLQQPGSSTSHRLLPGPQVLGPWLLGATAACAPVPPARLHGACGRRLHSAGPPGGGPTLRAAPAPLPPPQPRA